MSLRADLLAGCQPSQRLACVTSIGCGERGEAGGAAVLMGGLSSPAGVCLVPTQSVPSAPWPPWGWEGQPPQSCWASEVPPALVNHGGVLGPCGSRAAAEGAGLCRTTWPARFCAAVERMRENGGRLRACRPAHGHSAGPSEGGQKQRRRLKATRPE